jgi:ribonuclease HI
MYNVTIYTDGACSGNPGVGGYGAIITCNGAEKIVRGRSKEVTTNNRMELMAVISAIKALNKPCEITVYTDSQYICQNATHDRKWLTCEQRPNRDLWIELITVGLKGQHRIKFVKVAGHSGLVMNERCDRIAKEQCVKAKHELSGK